MTVPNTLLKTAPKSAAVNGHSASPHGPDPFDPQTAAIRHGEIGNSLLEQGQYADALTQFEQALDFNPHSVASWCGRAEALACVDRYEEALSSLEQAQDLAAHSDLRIWVQKAVVLILLQRYEAALSCCALVLQRQPNHVQGLLFQGVALHRLGRYRQAYRSYKQVKALTTPQVIRSHKGGHHEQKPYQAAC
jgi:tetratricopeptide (TPR) repeat protein